MYFPQILNFILIINYIELKEADILKLKYTITRYNINTIMLSLYIQTIYTYLYMPKWKIQNLEKCKHYLNGLDQSRKILYAFVLSNISHWESNILFLEKLDNAMK